MLNDDAVCIVQIEWGPRQESADRCARLLVDFFERVSAFLPHGGPVEAFWDAEGKWFVSEDGSGLSAERLISLVGASDRSDTQYVSAQGVPVSFGPDAHLTVGFGPTIIVGRGDHAFRLSSHVGSYSEHLRNQVTLHFPANIPFSGTAIELAKHIMGAAETIFDPETMVFSDWQHFHRCVDPETLAYAGALTYVRCRPNGLSFNSASVVPFGKGVLIEVESPSDSRDDAFCRWSQDVCLILRSRGLI